jgi:Putative beta-barrel porin 2
MKKEAFVCFFVTTLLMLTSVQVMAKGGRIHSGNLKVIPGITVEEVYDDNIYLGNGTNRTTELEESDWITHIKPGIMVDYGFAGQRGGLTLGYQGDLAYYDDNDQNDWRNHTGIFGLNYSAPGGLFFGVNNVYTSAEDPYGSDSQYKLGVAQTKRWENDLGSKLGFVFSNRLKVIGFYNYYKQDYKEREDFSQDYDDNEFGTGLEMKVFPKTWGFIRYHYGERDYYSHPAIVNGVATNSTNRNDADFDWHRVNMGLNWDSGAKLSGEVNFGYQWLDYDNRLDPVGNRYEDKDTWIASTAVNFEATKTTTLSLSIWRQVTPTGSNTKEFYEDTGVGLSLEQVFLAKFTLSVIGNYSSNDYNMPAVKKKNNDNYGAGIGLDYDIQDWLSAGVKYSYSKKDSNYRADEYSDNQFSLSVSLVY